MSQPSHFNGGNQSYNWEGLEFTVHCWQLQSDNRDEFYMVANCTVRIVRYLIDCRPFTLA